MNRRYSAILLAVAFCTTVSAQEKSAITPEVMKTLQQSYQAAPADRAARNALAANELRELIVNSANCSYDMNFNIRVPSEGITNQENSGRCWLFSALNVLRAEMIGRFDLPAFEFSESYGQFYDLLEKSNSFFESVIAYRKEPIDSRANAMLFKKPFGDGGQFANALNLLVKYGAVPKEVMPETHSSANNLQLMTTVRTKCREWGLRLREEPNPSEKSLRSIKVEALSEIYRILVLNLGLPTEQFEWTRYNSVGEKVSTATYTPKSFCDEFVGTDLSDRYLFFMNDPTREYYRLYEVALNRNCIEGGGWRYVNLPIDELRKMALRSLKAGKMVVFSCDVDKFRIPEQGLLDTECLDYESLLGMPFRMDKRQRILTCESTSTHAMALAGAEERADGTVEKWLVENSFGAANGRGGYLIMTDRWFEEYTFRLVVERQFVGDEIALIFNGRCTTLPAWNPAF